MAGRNVNALNTVIGDKDIAKILKDVLPKEANNLLRSTIDGIGSEIKKKASQNASNLGLRTISKAIKNKRKKSPPGKPTNIVFVEHGSGARNNAWYWHFHEFGTAQRHTKEGKPSGRLPERPFIRPARDAVAANLDQVAREQFQKKLSNRIKTLKRKRAGK